MCTRVCACMCTHVGLGEHSQVAGIPVSQPCGRRVSLWVSRVLAPLLSPSQAGPRLGKHLRVGPCLPAVEAADVLHIAEDDRLLAGHGCWHAGTTVQVLYVVALEELKLTHKGLL